MKLSRLCMYDMRGFAMPSCGLACSICFMCVWHVCMIVCVSVCFLCMYGMYVCVLCLYVLCVCILRMYGMLCMYVVHSCLYTRVL